MDKIYVGAVGVTILAKTHLILDGTEAITLRVETPSGTVKTWNASFYNADEGIISYTTTSANDLDESGMWKVQPHIVSTSVDVYGEEDSFKVYNLIGT